MDRLRVLGDGDALMCSFHGPSAEEREEYRRLHGHDMLPVPKFGNPIGWLNSAASYCPVCALKSIQRFATFHGFNLSLDGVPIADASVGATERGGRTVQDLIVKSQGAA